MLLLLPFPTCEIVDCVVLTRIAGTVSEGCVTGPHGKRQTPKSRTAHSSMDMHKREGRREPMGTEKSRTVNTQNDKKTSQNEHVTDRQLGKYGPKAVSIPQEAGDTKKIVF